MEDLQNKFVAVLNNKIPIGQLMNALGHMATGLSGSHPEIAAMRFDNYIDANGGEHKSISDYPFIIVQADNSNQLRTLRNELISTNVHFVDFTNTMTVGTFIEQKEKTKQTQENELEYFGVCMFGDKNIINPLTKKFSLWR